MVMATLARTIQKKKKIPKRQTFFRAFASHFCSLFLHVFFLAKRVTFIRYIFFGWIMHQIHHSNLTCQSTHTSLRLRR